MVLKDFIENFCNDIVTESVRRGDTSIFTYDAVITDDSGNSIKVIYDDDDNAIDIEDIIGLTSEEFLMKYNFKSALSAMQKYLSAYQLLTPKEMLSSLQQEISQFTSELDRWGDVNAFDI